MKVWHEKKLFKNTLPLRVHMRKWNIDYAKHWHEELEIIYVKSGTLQVGIQDYFINLKEDSVLVIGPGEIHYFVKTEKPPVVILLLVGMQFFEEILSQINPISYIKNFCHDIIKVTKESKPQLNKELSGYITDMVKEYRIKEQGYAIRIKAMLYLFITSLIRNNEVNQELNVHNSKVLKKRETIIALLKYIDKNYSLDLSIEKAAAKCNMSRYYFSHVFKECTGKTFLQHLNHVRVTKAQIALIDLNKTIADIAFDCGFKSIESFNRTFKQITGLNPSGFRKSKMSTFSIPNIN